MAKNDIFVHFPFFRIPNQWKKCKTGIYFCAFFVFLCFRFQSKTKNKKLKSITLNLLDQNRKISLEFIFFNLFSKMVKVFKKIL